MSATRVNRNTCYLCGNEKIEKLRYFRFPTQRERALKWIAACNIDPSSSVDHIFLCIRHFLETDFQPGKRQLLTHEAVPSQCLDVRKNLDQAEEKIPGNTGHCCVICENKSWESSYFTFPKDERMRSQWMEACKVRSCYNARVCERHFGKDDWSNDFRTAKRLRLKKNAVPKPKAAMNTVNNVQLNLDRNENPSRVSALSGTTEEQMMDVRHHFLYSILTNSENASTYILPDEPIRTACELDEPENRTLDRNVNVIALTPHKNIVCPSCGTVIDCTTTNRLANSEKGCAVTVEGSCEKPCRQRGSDHEYVRSQSANPGGEYAQAEVLTLRDQLQKLRGKMKVARQTIRRANKKILDLQDQLVQLYTIEED